MVNQELEKIVAEDRKWRLSQPSQTLEAARAQVQASLSGKTVPVKNCVNYGPHKPQQLVAHSKGHSQAVKTTIPLSTVPSPKPNMPPPDGDAWLSKIFEKSKAAMLVEAARTGKPPELPKVW